MMTITLAFFFYQGVNDAFIFILQAAAAAAY